MARPRVEAMLLAIVAASPSPPLTADSRPHACEIGRESALCATLAVWENRGAKTGRRIDLNIAILPALEHPRASDPLFVLDGGPGAPATELVPVFARHPIRRQRDIVMVDQRGSGGSHPLQCDLFGNPPDLRRVAAEQFPTDQVRLCRERLSKDADLTQYTTAIAADDLDEVRQWLGYAKINLWGGSYGSLAAQVYLRRHEANVRAVILEAVVPADELVPLHHAAAGQRALDIFFERNRSEYPHLREDFATMVERVRRGVDVAVRDRNGRSVTVRPGLETLAEGIRHRLYYDTGNTLASMIHRGAAGDLTPIVKAAIDAELALDGQLAMGLLLSVSCSEHIPYITDEMAAHETADTFLGDLRIRSQRAACSQWVRGSVPPDVHNPIRSNVPVLLLSGYRDSVTPPSFGDHVAGTLPNSKHVVFPNASHGVQNQCGRDLMATFIERGSVQSLDASCAAH